MSSPSAISRRDLLVAAAATPIAASLACRAERRDEPAPIAPVPPPAPRVPKHLFVIVSDDQSRFDVGCYGNADVHTAHLDRFAAQGTRFERGYVVVGVCKPSRSAMYTGLYPHKNGATGFKPVNADVATWCELLTPDVCATGMIGKLNVKPLEKFRFESWVRPKKIGDARSSDAVAGALRTMLDGFGGRRAAVVLNLKDPHRPFREPLEDDDPSTPVPHDPARVTLPPGFADTPETRAELAQYYDRVWRLDQTIGQVLSVLDERGIADDALVVFTSDNGQSFPFAKTTLYEAGINVPFLVRWPSVVGANTTSDAFVGLIDLLPTALDVFGVEARAELDGRSLLPLLRGDVPRLREFAVGEHTEHLLGKPTPARSLRDERFKYIRNFELEGEFENNVLDHSMTWRSWIRVSKDDPALRQRMQRLVRRPPEELYDLASDPRELVNLAADEMHAPKLVEMRARLADWMRTSADPLATV
jgi:N-sulfoglucosamine sulfohydrolase